MPNLTTTTLTICGKSEDLYLLREVAKGTPDEHDENVFDLSRFIPMPKYIEEDPETGWFPRWERWQARNWGTKNGTYLSELLENKPDGGLLKYSFATPYCTPSAAIREIAKQFPNLEFELNYSGEGGCIYGNAYYFDKYEIRQSANFSNYVDDVVENEILPDDADRIFTAKVNLLKKCIKQIEDTHQEISLKEIVFSFDEDETYKIDVYNSLAEIHGETITPIGKIGR